MFGTVLQVALGGAIGSSLRFGIGAALAGGDRAVLLGLPLPVLVVNVVGSFLMGLFVVFAQTRGVTHLSPFVMTGLLGGFTTFSAFSLEAVTLFERGQVGAAASYVICSVVFSIAGLALGLVLARGIWA